MSILYLLIGLALLLMGVAVALFAWTVRNSQYEDLDGPAYRILLDDDDFRIPGARADGEGRPDSAVGQGRKIETPPATVGTDRAEKRITRRVSTESGRERSSVIV